MRRRRALRFDVAIAALVAVLLVVLSPGLGLAALIALVALVVVGLSLVAGWGFSHLWSARRDRGTRL